MQYAWCDDNVDNMNDSLFHLLMPVVKFAQGFPFVPQQWYAVRLCAIPSSGIIVSLQVPLYVATRKNPLDFARILISIKLNNE